MLLVIFKIRGKMSSESYLLYSLFVPNKYLQLLSILLFLVFTGELFSKKLSKLNNAQRFYIFQNITEDLREISEDYICDYSLNFSFTDEEFMNELMNKIEKGFSNPLSDEDFLINTITKNDPNGENIVGNKYDFKTNNLFTYFYIVLYHIVLNIRE